MAGWLKRVAVVNYHVWNKVQIWVVQVKYCVCACVCSHARERDFLKAEFLSIQGWGLHFPKSTKHYDCKLCEQWRTALGNWSMGDGTCSGSASTTDMGSSWVCESTKRKTIPHRVRIRLCPEILESFKEAYAHGYVWTHGLEEHKSQTVDTGS